jgi:SRSO17 transposase
MDAAAQRRLEEYFDRIGHVLGHESRRGSFAIYAHGLFGDAERKSIEPIAARACPDPERIDAMHQRLLGFISASSWSDRDVRRAAATYAIEAMTEHEPIDAWLIDDTGFLKQGKHTVGVQRQYSGTAGKVANCQIGVSLCVATASAHLPIDFELYLPRAWADDAARRREARIPDDVLFRTKHELALDMIRRALADGVSKGVVLADAAYGNSFEFREELDRLGLDYIVGIDATTSLRLVDGVTDEPVSARDLALRMAYLPKQYQRVVWREASLTAVAMRPTVAFCGSSPSGATGRCNRRGSISPNFPATSPRST